MKKILCAFLIIFSVSSASAKTSIRLLLPKEAEVVEKNFLATSPKKNSSLKIYKSQAFSVSLNGKEFKSAVFAAFVDEITNEFQFTILAPEGKVILQDLPKSELAVTTIFSFRKIEAVSFKDVNNDGTLDILILTSFFDSRPVQGEGVGGGTMPIGFVFLSTKNKFEINDDCGEIDAKTMASLEKCARKLVKPAI